MAVGVLEGSRTLGNETSIKKDGVNFVDPINRFEMRRYARHGTRLIDIHHNEK